MFEKTFREISSCGFAFLKEPFFQQPAYQRALWLLLLEILVKYKFNITTCSFIKKIVV
jgi:hypothetical protein